MNEYLDVLIFSASSLIGLYIYYLIENENNTDELEDKLFTNEIDLDRDLYLNEDDYRNLSQNFSENLKCSITLDVIRDPVISKYGYSFEKSQIFLSLKNKNSCPLSNRELSLKDIRPNITLRNAIKYEILMEKYKRLFN